MNILLINGSPKENDDVSAMLSLWREFLKNQYEEANFLTYSFSSKKIGVGHCGYCGKCKISKSENLCIFGNSLGDLIHKVHVSDLIIIGTPLYSWGISTPLETALDKLYMEAVKFQLRNIRLIFACPEEKTDNKKAAALAFKQFRSLCEHLGWEFCVADTPRI